MGKLFVPFVLIYSVSALLVADSCLGSPEEAKAKAREALAASDAGDHEKAFLLWNDAISGGESELGTDAFRLARSYIYFEAFQLIQADAAGCSWARRGQEPGPPAYTEPFDVYYAGLMAAEGVCLFNEKSYEESYLKLYDAKLQLRNDSGSDAAELEQMVDEYLQIASGHVLGPGDYVTNKGALQVWIAKVLERSGREVRVRITYLKAGSKTSFSVGSTAELSVSDCRTLKAVSADAALKGWRG